MRPVNGDKCFTRTAIHVWCKKFAGGQESNVDEKDLADVLFRQLTFAAVEFLVQSDRRVSISV